VGSVDNLYTLIYIMNKLPIELVYNIYQYLITKCDMCNQTFYTSHMIKVCFSTRYFFNETNDRQVFRCVRCYINNKKNTYFIVFVVLYSILSFPVHNI